MSETTFHPGTCSCGGEFELSQEGTESSVLSSSGDRRYRLFNCPECGKGKRYLEEDGEWRHATM